MLQCCIVVDIHIGFKPVYVTDDVENDYFLDLHY